MKRYAATLVALLLFAGLLTYSLVRERGRVAEKEEVFSTEIRSDKDVAKIEVIKYDVPPTAPGAKPAPAAKHAEVRHISAEKHGDEWWVVQPFSGVMDPDNAKTMVKAVVELKPSVRKDKDINLNAPEFGLANPKFLVTVALTRGTTLRVSVGENTPVGSQAFAKIEGKEGLFLVPTSFTTDLDKDPDTLRDKKLARFEKEKVARVTFTNARGTVVAQKQGDEKDAKWQITTPGAFKGDEFALSTAFGKLNELDAKEFGDRPNDLKLYGLDRPRAECKVETRDGKSYDVIVGSQVRKKVKKEYGTETEDKDLVYAMRRGRPEVLLVETSLFDELNKDVFAFRDKRLFDFKRDDVEIVDVSRTKGLSFTAGRTKEEWEVRAPQHAKGNRNKLDDILWDLCDLEAKEYLASDVDLRQCGLAVPSTVVTLTLKNGRQVKIKFGDEIKNVAVGGPWYYCQTSDSSQVYKVSESALKDLPAKFEDLKQDSSNPASMGLTPPPPTGANMPGPPPGSQ